MDFKKNFSQRAAYFFIFVLLQLICCFIPEISKKDLLVFALQTLSILLPTYLYFKPDFKKFILNSAVTYCLIL